MRTREKREIDFLIIRDGRPWFLVEVKSSDNSLSPHLEYFQQTTGADHAFQVIVNAPFAKVDCFAMPYPVKVPAITLLSQLV